MESSRPVRVARKMPPSERRVIPWESSSTGHWFLFLLDQ